MQDSLKKKLTHRPKLLTSDLTNKVTCVSDTTALESLNRSQSIDRIQNLLGVAEKLNVSYADLAPKKHQLSIPSKIKCSKCYFRTTRQDLLKQHIEQVHDRDNLFNCPVCDYSACDETVLNCHMEGHPDVKRFKCDLCEFLTTSKINFEVHAIRCHSKRFYFCSSCDFGSYNRDSYSSHKTVHPSIRDYRSKFGLRNSQKFHEPKSDEVISFKLQLDASDSNSNKFVNKNQKRYKVITKRYKVVSSNENSVIGPLSAGGKRDLTKCRVKRPLQPYLVNLKKVKFDVENGEIKNSAKISINSGSKSLDVYDGSTDNSKGERHLLSNEPSTPIYFSNNQMDSSVKLNLSGKSDEKCGLVVNLMDICESVDFKVDGLVDESKSVGSIGCLGAKFGGSTNVSDKGCYNTVGHLSRQVETTLINNSNSVAIDKSLFSNSEVSNSVVTDVTAITIKEISSVASEDTLIADSHYKWIERNAVLETVSDKERFNPVGYFSCEVGSVCDTSLISGSDKGISAAVEKSLFSLSDKGMNSVATHKFSHSDNELISVAIDKSVFSCSDEGLNSVIDKVAITKKDINTVIFDEPCISNFDKRLISVGSNETISNGVNIFAIDKSVFCSDDGLNSVAFGKSVLSNSDGGSNSSAIDKLAITKKEAISVAFAQPIAVFDNKLNRVESNSDDVTNSVAFQETEITNSDDCGTVDNAGSNSDEVNNVDSNDYLIKYYNKDNCGDKFIPYDSISSGFLKDTDLDVVSNKQSCCSVDPTSFNAIYLNRDKIDSGNCFINVDNELIGFKDVVNISNDRARCQSVISDSERLDGETSGNVSSEIHTADGLNLNSSNRCFGIVVAPNGFHNPVGNFENAQFPSESEEFLNSFIERLDSKDSDAYSSKDDDYISLNLIDMIAHEDNYLSKLVGSDIGELDDWMTRDVQSLDSRSNVGICRNSSDVCYDENSSGDVKLDGVHRKNDILDCDEIDSVVSTDVTLCKNDASVSIDVKRDFRSSVFDDTLKTDFVNCKTKSLTFEFGKPTSFFGDQFNFKSNLFVNLDDKFEIDTTNFDDDVFGINGNINYFGPSLKNQCDMEIGDSSSKSDSNGRKRRRVFGPSTPYRKSRSHGRSVRPIIQR